MPVLSSGLCPGVFIEWLCCYGNIAIDCNAVGVVDFGENLWTKKLFDAAGFVGADGHQDKKYDKKNCDKLKRHSEECGIKQSPEMSPFVVHSVSINILFVPRRRREDKIH